MSLFGKTTLVRQTLIPASAACLDVLVNPSISTSQGLTYSLVAAEALLAPAIPSVAARAGGLFLPLAKALCLACGACVSRPASSATCSFC